MESENAVCQMEEFKMNISSALFSNYSCSSGNGRCVNTLDQYPTDFYSSGPFFTLQQMNREKEEQGKERKKPSET